MRVIFAGAVFGEVGVSLFFLAGATFRENFGR